MSYASAAGCAAAAPTDSTVRVTEIPAPAITGSMRALAGSTVAYSTSIGMSSYTWTVSGGGSITSGVGTH